MHSEQRSPISYPNSHFIIIALFLFIFTVGGCFQRPSTRDGAPHYYVDISKVHNAVPHYLPRSKYGNPRYYNIHGRRYRVLKSARGYDRRGIASWYGTKFDGHLTSTREKYSLLKMTAASPELPIPCYVRVTNLENGKQIIVKVNDRGPFAANRILDLSYVAARKLGYEGRGTAMVEVTSVDMPNPLNHARTYFAHHNPHLYLQAGAFTNSYYAQNMEYHLERVTHRPIHIAHLRGESLYRVEIGPLKNAEESDRLQIRIAQAGLGHAITIIG